MIASPAPITPTGASAPTASLPAGTGAALAETLHHVRRDRRVPALSAAVARGGETVWADAVGAARLGADGRDEPVTTDTAFRVGSITKPMTAVAVLRLVASGRLGLDDPVGRHVPDAPAPTATVAQHLTHTAGLPAEPPGPWWERHGAGTWEELVASGARPLWAPGERHHYSNLGYAVLGHLLSQAHGRAWDDVLHEEVWAPLGMSSTGRVPLGPAATGYAVHPHADAVLPEPVAAYGAMGPAGEVWSTPGDLALFASWLVGAGGWADDGRVLSPEWRRRMRIARVAVDEPGAASMSAWTLGLSVRQPRPGSVARTVGHGGSVPGFTASVRADAATGDVVAVCGSSTAGFGDESAFRDLLGRAPSSAPAPRQGPGRTVPELALTGTWYWGPVPHTVSLQADGTLALRAAGDVGRGTAFEPDPDAAGAWVGVDGGYWLGERLRPVAAAVPSGEGASPVALDVGTFHLTRAPYDPSTEVPGGLDPAGWRPWAR
ncbi:beta-lactamase family protein [Isoptericola sp. NEAU-Y5]|uniref:Beta-lactamase family protein n=1 Tax=Isoptericola luteus TaxID=2879484 RepID=A0ABS7ZFW2_9MICO|nr:serine hydrolase domain-containing protein [Isoptericola sp. NEAU-Y5]MCA5893803.1 beta-lactamase family protein [Isoptericola sp. NEAU-Y5]